MISNIQQPPLKKNNSECINLFNSINWAQHPLGLPDKWPQSLHSTLSILFYSKFPMFLWWGPDLYCFYNDAYRPSLGKTGKHPAAMGEKGNVVWPEIWDVIYPEIEQVMNGGEATWHEDLYLPIFRNNRMEDVYWTYSYSPVIGESEKVVGVLVTCNETTEKIINAKQLLNLTDQLKINEAALLHSNEALEHFAYVASHDLQEPLRMVTSFMGLLKNKYSHQLDEKANVYIDYAIDGGKRMQKMIADLLELSRTGFEVVKELVDMNDVLKEVMQNICKLIDETGTKIIATSELPVLEIYRSEMIRLLQNLFSNAIKFRKKVIDPEIKIKATETNDEWLFTIQDNGIGIEHDKFERIFEVFVRLHSQEAYEGTGIGLAVCKKVVEHHGGRIWIESEEGQGTTFYFNIQK